MTQPQNNLTRRVCELIQSNIDHITVKKIAKEFSLDPCHFSRIFKKNTGVTCRQFLIETKMNKSKQLLQDHSKSIKEIAYDVGYKNPNHFSQIFKKKEGLSPTEYRKNGCP